MLKASNVKTFKVVFFENCTCWTMLDGKCDGTSFETVYGQGKTNEENDGQTNEENDGYSALKLHISKLNPACEALFQYPKRNWKPDDKTWYENRPLGINKLGDMMKDITSMVGGEIK